MDKKSRFNNEFRPMLAASSIGMVFVFSIVIGTLIGVWLDGKLNTKPYLTVFFLFIGITAGIKNAYYFIKQSGVMDMVKEHKDNEARIKEDNKKGK